MKTFKPLLVIVAIVTFTNCRKENAEPNGSLDKNSIPGKTRQWLFAQAKQVSPTRGSIIQRLESSLNFTGLWVEDFRNGKLTVIPLDASFEMVAGEKGAKNYFVLVLNEKGEILKGNVLQFSSTTFNGAELKRGMLARIFQHDEGIQDGKYAVYTIWNDLRYRLTFKGGKLGSVSEKVNNRNRSRLATGCIDWYLVTTIYYMDGTTETYEEYIGTTCGGPGENQEMQPGPGGGGNDIEYEYEKRRYPQWVVYNWGNADGQVWSRECIRGKQVTGSPQGGQLISIQHLSSECNRFGGVWGETNSSTSISSNVASVSVTGRWYAENIPLPFEITNFKSWTYSEAFP